ncbi:hypothetical protein [Fictibacillus barbaricus]|uniref:Peptide/nickel transport system permease protein n=1 Tax=Fictibacillus barbaricus TaxID=182136 RepID=A0ABU1U4B7_9BACL|nr:hypothetical protein [Fictibacillus barbaricus]MDR7074321.1 peptide/nickel transport system permease protein [Fictibacillus barbaricus]
MILKTFMQPSFLFGFLFILVLLIFSYHWPAIFDVNKEKSLELLTNKYNDEGTVIAVPPFKPSDVPPFGTDVAGKNLFYQIIDGAKYTILIAFGIAFFRVFVSVVIALYSPKSKISYLDDLVQATLYIPGTILAYMLMTALFSKQAMEPMSSTKLIIMQFFILIMIGVLPLISTFSNEINSLLNKDYIVSTIALGSKKTYVYYKHVLPELTEKLVLVFAQQMIQSLILLAHLGVLAVFIGGSVTLFMGEPLEPIPFPIPIEGEWAGIIGMSFAKLQVTPWAVLFPLAFFAVTIFAMNLMIRGIQNSFEVKSRNSGVIK